jgi:hypothetical protein
VLPLQLNAILVGRTVNVSENDELRTNLLVAIKARDADAFEVAVSAAFASGLPYDLADVFSEALLMPWHPRHEDLVSALQKMKNPASVEALCTAATTHHAYLDYDELFGLARKCTWALADIGTPLARKKLDELATNPNPTIAAYARKRLDHWDEELPRKGR